MPKLKRKSQEKDIKNKAPYPKCVNSMILAKLAVAVQYSYLRQKEVTQKE
jgi:hypothetical protein